MKKLFDLTGSSRLLLSALALTVIIFSACSKNDDNQFDPPAAGKLMVFNLAPDKPSVAFTLSGNPLGNAPLGYTSFSGTYFNIFPGNRELRSVDFNNGATIATSTETYNDSSYYSAFLLGVNGQYRHVVTEDDYSDVVPVTGKAWVRYINAIADTSATANITVAGTTEAAAYGTISAFRQVDAGAVTFAIASEQANASRTITTTENRIYTILFVGIPGATAPGAAPEIKFIENGIATND